MQTPRTYSTSAAITVGTFETLLELGVQKSATPIRCGTFLITLKAENQNEPSGESKISSLCNCLQAPSRHCVTAKPSQRL